MPLTMRAAQRESWAEITVSGRVVQADVRSLLPDLRQAADRYDTLRVVEVIAGFQGYEFGSIWPLFERDIDLLSKVTHAAVVCDFGWTGPLTRAAGLVGPITYRSFLTHDRDAARTWIAHPDTTMGLARQLGEPLPVAD
ncbi:MAG: STAS/SEC14 domain-containing protein [Pseudomonadota bacterium]